MNKFLIIFLIFVFNCQFASMSMAYSDYLYPIDKVEGFCREKNDSDAGAALCTNEATKKWKKVVDEEYNKVLNILPESKKQLFIDSHKEWEDFVKQDIKTFKSINPVIKSCEARSIDASFRQKAYRARFIMLNLIIFTANLK